MKGKQFILLFMALLLPVFIFLFLKRFGKNKFDVMPLYVTERPKPDADCGTVSIPYYVPVSVMNQLMVSNDSLVLLSFGELLPGEVSHLRRVEEKFSGGYVRHHNFSDAGEKTNWLKRCIFFLKEPFDMVLVDREGRIRGQYSSSDRDEIDRLLTEITIILKKY